MGATNGYNFGVTRGRGLRVWKRLLPCLQALRGGKFDIGKKVFTGARNPRFGDEAAVSERSFSVVQVVGDVV